MLSNRDFRRVKVSLDKALFKPQLLPYMRRRIMEDTLDNIMTLTDNEIEEYLSTSVGASGDETKEEG